MATSTIKKITPENIGAAADSAAMQYRGFYPNGQSMFSLAPGYYTTTDNNLPSEGLPAYGTGHGELSISHTDYYPQIVWISALKDFSYWDTNNGQWVIIQREGVTPVTSGGTGATTQADARTNLGIHYTDVFIPMNDTICITDLSATNTQILSVLLVNSMSSVCNITGIYPLNGVWYITCDAVQVNTAQVRIFYVTV